MNNNLPTLKASHEGFLSLIETQKLLKNLRRQRNNIIDTLLTQSVLTNKTDSEIRTMAAEAKGYRDIIKYIEEKHESIA